MNTTKAPNQLTLREVVKLLWDRKNWHRHEVPAFSQMGIVVHKPTDHYFFSSCNCIALRHDDHPKDSREFGKFAWTFVVAPLAMLVRRSIRKREK